MDAPYSVRTAHDCWHLISERDLRTAYHVGAHAHLRSGFNLLFYGFGSKLKLLDEFGKSMLSAYPLVTVEGYSPTTTVRNVHCPFVVVSCRVVSRVSPPTLTSFPVADYRATQLLTMITQSVLGVVQPMPAEPMDHCRVLQTMFHSQVPTSPHPHRLSR